MCFKLNFEITKDYMVGFFAGLIASLVVVISLNEEAQFNNNTLFFWGIIFFIVGLLGVNFVYYMMKK